ncbi:hypothetical protein IGI42_004335 [Enterococcus sp. AZ109]
MVYSIQPSRQVKSYLKKCNDRKLKQLFVDLIYEEIATNPRGGTPKKGDLSGVWTMGFVYKKVHYRAAYEIINEVIVPIYLLGSHENFYRELKRMLDRQ